MNYTGNLQWLKERTILYVLSGSRAYGMQTAESDWDYKGIAIPPESYRRGFLQHFDQAEFKPHENAEATVFNVQKFFKLAADANPNVLEILYTADEDVFEIDNCGKLLRENRDLFLSKKALYTYRGYAVSQLKRIQTHRKWLLNPPTHQPTRLEFGIERERGISSEQITAALTAIKNKTDSWEIDYAETAESTKIYIQEQLRDYLFDITVDQKFQRAAEILGFDSNFIEYLAKEKNYKQALAYYNQYAEWKANRNPKRAALEEASGYDLKHASHLIRLLLQCKEILEEGVVKVKRPDAQYLLDIRNGLYSYDEIVELAEKMDKELIVSAQTSKLQHSPDRNKLDELCIQLIERRER